jgi:hypothetical protein
MWLHLRSILAATSCQQAQKECGVHWHVGRTLVKEITVGKIHSSVWLSLQWENPNQKKQSNHIGAPMNKKKFWSISTALPLVTHAFGKSNAFLSTWLQKTSANPNHRAAVFFFFLSFHYFVIFIFPYMCTHFWDHLPPFLLSFVFWFCWRENITDNKKDISFLLVW